MILFLAIALHFSSAAITEFVFKDLRGLEKVIIPYQGKELNFDSIRNHNWCIWCFICKSKNQSWILFAMRNPKSGVLSAKMSPSLGSNLHRVTETCLSLGRETQDLNFLYQKKPQRSSLVCSLSSLVLDLIVKGIQIMPENFCSLSLKSQEFIKTIFVAVESRQLKDTLAWDSFLTQKNIYAHRNNWRNRKLVYGFTPNSFYWRECLQKLILTLAVSKKLVFHPCFLFTYA